MGNKIVIDACVAIDLNVHKVEFIDAFLSLLDTDEVHISSINFEEIKDKGIQKKLKSCPNVIITNTDTKSFAEFSKELESLRINMTIKDRHVLFLANDISANYVVSSDLNVFDKTVAYRRQRGYKHLEALTTVSLLTYLYKKERIGYDTFLEKSLYLFKNKEISNLLNHLGNANLNTNREEQRNILNSHDVIFKERFELYREPVTSEFNQLWRRTRMQT